MINKETLENIFSNLTFYSWNETMQNFTPKKNPWNNPVTVVYGTCISSEKSALIQKNITLIDTE